MEGKQEMECSVTEYRILKYFLENKNQVLTQNQILEAVWDLDGKFVNPNTLQVNIEGFGKDRERSFQSQIHQDDPGDRLYMGGMRMTEELMYGICADVSFYVWLSVWRRDSIIEGTEKVFKSPSDL